MTEIECYKKLYNIPEWIIPHYRSRRESKFKYKISPSKKEYKDCGITIETTVVKLNQRRNRDEKGNKGVFKIAVLQRGWVYINGDGYGY